MTEWVAKQRKSLANNYPLMTGILVWCSLIVVSSLYITLPLVSVFVSSFHVTPSTAAWTSSAFSFFYAIGFLLFSPLSDRYGRKQMMMSGLVALLLITPTLGFVTNLSSLIVLRALQGLAAATFAPAVLAYVVEMFPAHKRVTTIGFVSTGFLLAGIAGQLFSSIISQSLGWPYVFYFLGGLYLVCAILLGSLVPNGAIHQTTAGARAPLKQIAAVLFRKSLFVCYIITVTLLFSFVGMYTALGSYLTQTPFQLNPDQILLVRAAGILGMILSLFAGRLVAKFGVKRVLQAGLGLAAAGLSIVGFSSNLSILIVMSVIFVGGISVTVPTLISLVGSTVGHARGTAISLYSFILFIGATLGPIVVLNLLKLGSYFLTFEALAVVLCIALCSSFFIKIQEV
ncbi:MFS transporter [Paenibacillus sp. FSL H7-0331]|uniref:MFS transporter n=1 Tax=Paenibacillus sp. FSL H7-0331 TaxID=1920421 RepID=UPI00096D9AFC|nr:MFS transporter [Paenibacillus sp. FSL H7-0331]OMF11318.1 MFS transporter [Paenibacillus sp. FSL H7-0331]